MDVQLAESEEEILGCYPVLRELRPAIQEADFVAKIRRQRESGYLLAFCHDGAETASVAGFRIGENLAWGRYLYVEDLVTRASARSKGYGHLLLHWLREYARKHHCQQLHLDSGMQRKEAHRFYEREGMIAAGYHFFRVIRE